MRSASPPPTRPLLSGLLLVVSATAAVAADPPPTPWNFKEGDRVVFVGDTFIERDQRHGYLETVLTLANSDKEVTFRNLGWSGDNVRGLSRAGFDPPEAGTRELIKQVTESKPTVLVVGYGMADSFDGEAGLSRFVEGYNAFLDAVAPTKARLILLSPLPHETMPAPLPDPTAHNRDLKLYADAVGKIAASRRAAFVDLFDAFSKDRARLDARPTGASPDTDNGIHLTEVGSWRLANLPILGLVPAPRAKTKAVQGDQEPLKYVAAETLPAPASPEKGATSHNVRKVRFEKLKPGRYTLKIDGKPVATKTDAEWADGHTLDAVPEEEQVEKLRRAIVAKNLLFFYRWRPQNITYLFGFRKHEQGQNAVEIPQFDPLVDAKEKEIAALRKPVPHTYELVSESEGSR